MQTRLRVVAGPGLGQHLLCGGADEGETAGQLRHHRRHGQERAAGGGEGGVVSTGVRGAGARVGVWMARHVHRVQLAQEGHCRTRGAAENVRAQAGAGEVVRVRQAVPAQPLAHQGAGSPLGEAESPERP